jgi:hypothetical protein
VPYFFEILACRVGIRISGEYLAFREHFACLVYLQEMALFGEKHVRGYLGSEGMVGEDFDGVEGKPAECQSEVRRDLMFVRRWRVWPACFVMIELTMEWR